MEKITKDKLADSIRSFHLPRYDQIPDVGLYLEQCVKLINTYLRSLTEGDITSNMISNYVKKGIVKNPVKKQYYKEHLAKLIFIAVTKSVVSLEDIKMLLEIQGESYDVDIAYDYFCEEFENVLRYTFGVESELKNIGTTESEQKDLLRNAIVAVVNKIYLDKYIMIFRNMRSEALLGHEAAEKH